MKARTVVTIGLMLVLLVCCGPSPMDEALVELDAAMTELHRNLDELEQAINDQEEEPIPTPEIIIESGEIDVSVWGMWTFAPPTGEEVLEIRWSGDIIITDALSRTVTVAGPATVRFAE